MEDEIGNPHEAARLLEEAKNMVSYDPTNPTWMYRMKAGKIESKIFPADSIPEGWVDSPAKCEEPLDEKIEPEAPKRRGRPRKVNNGDSA